MRPNAKKYPRKKQLHKKGKYKCTVNAIPKPLCMQ